MENIGAAVRGLDDATWGRRPMVATGCRRRSSAICATSRSRGLPDEIPSRSAARRRAMLEPAQGGRDVDASGEHRRQRVAELLEARRRRLDREAPRIELRGDLVPADAPEVFT